MNTQTGVSRNPGLRVEFVSIGRLTLSPARGKGLFVPSTNIQILVFSAFLLVGGVLGFLLVTLPRFMAPRHASELKSTTYECGEQPVGEPWIHFRVAYYIFALAFVVFDVEAVFLFPWAVVLRKLGVAGLIQMAVFIGILLLGLVYAWRKGVLKWR